jgi:hypothetical protein
MTGGQLFHTIKAFPQGRAAEPQATAQQDAAISEGGHKGHPYVLRPFAVR